MKKSKIFIIIAVLALLFFAFKYFNVQDLLRESLDYIAGLGFAGALIYFVVYVLACVFLLPGSILTLGAGAIYGVLWGSVLVSLCSTLGATAAFLVGRYFARDWVNKKVEGNPKFKAVDEAVADEGWKIVGLTRLSPIFPFNILNYSYGLTKVKLRDYVIASWIGMMPGTVMYVYIGSLAGDLATLGMNERSKSPAEWALYVVGLLATVIVTVYVTKIAKKALNERIKD